MNGVINVYKERGYTSFDVVAKLRGILKQKKIGHTGTLDPDAEGVLPVCLGSATRACELLTEKDKEYEAVLLFGRITDTQDITGTVLEEHPVTISEEEAKRCLLSFQGEYDQIPPMYSALKVNGKKLYELAREGKVIERQPRRVTIYELRILETSFDGEEKWIRFAVTCSKGTYIRTLCEDVGRKAGCGGCMKSLRRTRVSSFLEQDSLTLAQIEQYRDEGRMDEILLSTERLFLRFPAMQTKPEADKLLQNGNKLSKGSLRAYRDEPNEEAGRVALSDGKAAEGVTGPIDDIQPWYRIYDSTGRFTALYQYEEAERLYRNVKMFGTQE
ncbi:MAG: tRNA pseudouridine(55) synthase TruB [Lachnospiraceae bacterium]|nr:tRNA pseudouridine(55) synthase TruB [Lachnospiraceae bacterium]